MNGPPSLLGQTALVTGAAAGIGRAVALVLAEHGAFVALVDCDEPGLEGTAARITTLGGTASIHCLDLAESLAIPPLVEAILRVRGGIGILVNCAGIVGPGTNILDADATSWDQIFAVNVKAPFLLMKHAGQAMAARGGGRIVNITSSSAHRALRSLPAYGASKSALMQLTRSAAADLGPHNINVNAVAPGLTATRIVREHFTAEALTEALSTGPLANLLNRVTEPQDVAAAVLFLCQPSSRQITGQTLHVSGGAIV